MLPIAVVAGLIGSTVVVPGVGTLPALPLVGAVVGMPLPLGAAAILRRSLLVYGVGGVIAPFVGIKVIDVGLRAMGAY